MGGGPIGPWRQRSSACAASPACLCWLGADRATNAPPQKKKHSLSSAPWPLPANASAKLAAIKQIIFVRHGQHGDILGKDTPCLSELGAAHAMMLTQYLDDHRPAGVKKPTMVYAMNGSTTAAIPPTVRCVNTAVPYVVMNKIPKAKFNTAFTQQEPAHVAADMLDSAAGETVLNIWLHWEAVYMLNYMGIPTTGWNDFDLDAKTKDDYNPVIVVTPGKDAVNVRLHRTPRVNPDTLLADFANKTELAKVYWETNVPWDVVAKQQGNTTRLVEPADKKDDKKA